MKNDQAQIINGILWLHYGDRTFTVDTNAGRKARKKTGKASSDLVTAPMPGKITKLMVKAGDVVTAGQPVLVMEAMKMEYTLKTEVSGSIDKVACAVGEQVVLGKQLVKIKV